MDVVHHHVAQRRVDRAMPRERRHSGKDRTDDVHAEVPLAAARAGMADVFVAVIADIQ
jgi:hypothetical protein